MWSHIELSNGEATNKARDKFQFVKTKISPKFPLLLYTISQTSELSRTSGSLYTGNTDVSCFSIPQKSLIYSAFLFHRNPDFQRFPFL